MRDLSGAEGLNAATGDYEDLVKLGVIDAAKVTRSALQNAASIAALFLTTEAVIADKPEKAAGRRRHARRRRHGLLSHTTQSGFASEARATARALVASGVERERQSSSTSSTASSSASRLPAKLSSSIVASSVASSIDSQTNTPTTAPISGNDDEHPQLAERVRVGVGEDRRRQAAGRVDARVVDRDRDEVDQRASVMPADERRRSRRANVASLIVDSSTTTTREQRR